MQDTEILCRWDRPTVPAFYNTMIFHRGYNELSNIDRVVLSCAVEDFSDINVCYRKYQGGTLFKNQINKLCKCRRTIKLSNKTPYEIRLELIQEARLILQAQANKPDLMPSTEDVIKEAEKLNQFISRKPDQK